MTASYQNAVQNCKIAQLLAKIEALELPQNWNSLTLRYYLNRATIDHQMEDFKEAIVDEKYEKAGHSLAYVIRIMLDFSL